MSNNKIIKELKIQKFEEVIAREAKNFGVNGSHIILPAKYKHKQCLIICLEDLK